MQTALHPAQLLRRVEVERRTGLARSTVYELIRTGRFPAPIELTGRTRCWIESEVNCWIEERIKAARVQPTAK